MPPLFFLAAALNASTIGVAANGTCEAGSCPATAMPFSSTATLPVDFTVTLTDGDRYLLNGSFTGTNNASGAFSTGHLFQVTYEGNASGGDSAADTLTIEADYAFQTTLSSRVVDRNVGAFSPAISAASSAISCVNGKLGCLGPVTPPNSFDLSTSFSLSSSGGEFVYDPAFTNNFGAGSAVGS